MQMVYGVEQQQAVAELQPGGQDVDQKRDATDDPAPAAVGIEVLPSTKYQVQEKEEKKRSREDAWETQGKQKQTA